VLGLLKIKDITTGYKATRVKGVMDQLDLDSVMSQGFAYKIDLLFRMHKFGVKIVEIPINFGLRGRGDSKMEQSNFMDSLRVVLTIRYNESKSFFKFAVVGFTGFGSDTLLFNIFRLTVLPSDYSSAASGFLATIVTFLLNNAWSFGHNKIKSFSGKLKMFVPYALSSYIPILFRSWLIGFVTAKFADTALIANAAFLFGVAVGLVWNYTVYSKIIWRNKKS